MITCAIRDDPKFRNKRLAFVNGINAIHEATNTSSANSTAITTTVPALTDKQIELLQVLKRRNFPLAFRDDATNEDIVQVMQGKLANSVVLPRDMEHFYPRLVFSVKNEDIAEKIKEPQIQ